MRSLWKGLTPFSAHLFLKYALRMGTNATYQNLLRDDVSPRCMQVIVMFTSASSAFSPALGMLAIASILCSTFQQ